MASKKSVAATKTATKSKRPAAFISAPPDVNTSELAGALEARGLNVLRADEIGIGMSWSESLRQSLKRADYVIAVVGERPNANVLYELGMASGMDKPVLVLASQHGLLPFSLSGLPYLNADPDNLKAINFGLDQLLATPKTKAKVVPSSESETHPIGDLADHLLEVVEQIREKSDRKHKDITEVIEQSIKESGVPSLSKEGNFSPRRSEDLPFRRADLVVWSSDLESWVGNPLIIEVKTELRGKSDIDMAITRLSGVLKETRSPFGLLLYLTAKPAILYGTFYDPRVLVMSIEEFIGGLKSEGLGEFLRRTRFELLLAKG